MAFQEATSWLSPLSRGAQAPRRVACCVGMLARVPRLTPEAVCAPVFTMKRAEQSSPLLPRCSPALPCSPVPRRAAGMGQLGQLEADAALDLGETPSRSAICWVQGRQRRAAPVLTLAWLPGGKQGISRRGFLLCPQARWACLFAEGHEEDCVKKELLVLRNLMSLV